MKTRKPCWCERRDPRAPIPPGSNPDPKSTNSRKSLLRNVFVCRADFSVVASQVASHKPPICFLSLSLSAPARFPSHSEPSAAQSSAFWSKISSKFARTAGKLNHPPARIGDQMSRLMRWGPASRLGPKSVGVIGAGLLGPLASGLFWPSNVPNAFCVREDIDGR